MNRLTELERHVVCGIFRGRIIEQEYADKVERIRELAETNLVSALAEAKKTFRPVDASHEPLVAMTIEGTGMRKPLYHCPQLEWKTARNGSARSMDDYYLTASDVDANVPLCFERVDEHTVRLTAAEERITLDKIPAVVKELEGLFGNGQLARAAVAVEHENATRCRSCGADYGGVGLGFGSGVLGPINA